MEYGYIRVSGKDQNTDRQFQAFEKLNVNKKCIFVDKSSGKDFERTAYKQLIKN